MFKVVLYRALHDMNLPRFISDDAVLFNGLMQDLFPGLEPAPVSMKTLEDAIRVRDQHTTTFQGQRRPILIFI